MSIRHLLLARPSRGGQSLHSGKAWEVQLATRLTTLHFNGEPVHVGATAGGGHGIDIPTTIGGIPIGFEAGTNKFEGGGCTLRLVDRVLVVPESHPLLRTLMGTHRPWGVAPSLEAKCPEDHFPVPSDSVARYYSEKGCHYFSLAKKGLYHTGNDVLNLGVPFLDLPGTYLRSRVTKHMKNGKPTDYTTALVFPLAKLAPSPYSFFGTLPPGFTVGSPPPTTA